MAKKESKIRQIETDVENIQCPNYPNKPIDVKFMNCQSNTIYKLISLDTNSEGSIIELRIWCQDAATSHIWTTTMQIIGFQFELSKNLLCVYI